MKTRDLSTLFVSGAIALVLVVVATALLVRFVGRYRRVTAELTSQTEQLDRLRRRDPFPNEANVAAAEEKHQRLQQAYAELRSELARAPSRRPPSESAHWGLLRDRLFIALREQARQADIEVPDAFAYGFERYVGGRLPRRAHLPRLTRQLHYVDQLVGTLFEHKIRGIKRIDRHLFEDDLPESVPDDWAVEPVRERRPRRREDRPADGTTMEPGYFEHPDGLYTRERIVVTFTAREPAVWSVLDALAHMDVFSAVSRVRIENPTPPPAATPRDPDEEARRDGRAPLRPAPAPPGERRPPADWPVDPSDPETVPPRGPRPIEERVVAGLDELVTVSLEIDFFEFGDSVPTQEETP